MRQPAEEAARQEMVHTQLRGRGIRAQALLDAFCRVPRHLFVPAPGRAAAYADHPLPIGAGQTISQPYIVAYTLEKAELKRTDRVLEIGTGSGYQTALLAELVAEVYSIERVETLAARARSLLRDLGYSGIQFRIGDGSQGWREFAPYDAIVGSAAAAEIPSPLLHQLRTDGRLVLPVGSLHQQLVLVRRRSSDQFERTPLLPVRFVPMIIGA